MLDAEDIAQLRRLMELREKRDSAKVALETAETDYREAEADLYEKLSSGPMSRLNNVDLGEPWGKVSFGARETYFGKIIKGMEDDALEYFNERAMTEEVSAPKFVMKRINEIVRSRKEANEPMPPGVDFYANRGVTITREKK